MKELTKKRWFVFLLGILIAVVALLGIGFILYCNGYRIVYPEQFETSWDAVSGFAAWFGVIVSVVSAAASFFAIWFAVRVADQQNKIALFEKRYQCWTKIQNLWACARWIKELKTNQGIYLGFRTYFGETQRIITDYEEPLEFALRFNREQETISSGIFLFSHYDAELLKKIISIGVKLIAEVSKHLSEKDKNNISEKAESLMNEFYNLCEKYVNTYAEKMQQELQLNNS